MTIKTKITDAALRLLTRDLSAFIRLLGNLEARLATHIDNENARLADVDAEISALTADRARIVSNTKLATGLQQGISNLRG